MEFEEEVVAYGVDAWSTDDDDDDNFVDDFLWMVVNACVSGQDIRSSDAWKSMNQALTQTQSGPFFYRLGNLGMTYDPDLVEHIVHTDDEIIETESFGELLATLRKIYVAHEEEQAVHLLDAFMSRVSPCIVLKMPLDAVM